MIVWQDIRYGARTLVNSPGFALTAVLTMALGIGVTTSIFSVCDAMLWRPVPLPHLDTLVSLLQAEPGDPDHWEDATAGDIDDIQRETTSLASVASWQNGLANMASPGVEPERVLQALVTPNLFDVVGVQPARGHAFQPGTDHEVILSDGYWRRRFGADPSIVGRSIRLDDQSYTVTGIMPATFDFPLATEVWTPLAF